MSAGLAPENSALRPSRAALRPSLVEKSATTAFTRPLALESVATFASAAPPANDSFKRPQSPLGSAALTGTPPIIGLFKSHAHSPFVKLVLSAIVFLLMFIRHKSRRQSAHAAADFSKHRRRAICLGQNAPTASGDQE